MRLTKVIREQIQSQNSQVILKKMSTENIKLIVVVKQLKIFLLQLNL